MSSGLAMNLDRDFKEFLESFVARDVRFLIVGGYAVAAHGLPRATGDMDAWISVDPANAQRIVDALEDFGFGSLGVRATDFTRPDVVIQLGFPPHRIDIMTGIEGVDFESAWNRRLVVVVDGMEIGFIGREDLIANKRALGRPQDLADVARLEGE